ncbi:MAG: NAD(P)H-binding protein [Thermoleophilaceae bacterium]|nr:NAD(P)H-binding protein [Thermoleophilaceae bacterium]
MVLVFGATGFSGRMVVRELAARGIPVRAAARSREKLELLAERFPGTESFVADVADPGSVERACAGAELLITTVGPYTSTGHVAAEAALSAEIPYIDITGEPGWLRRVFGEFGPRFADRGLAMLPAFGYDYVPGNLAGAIALERAGGAAVRVDIGYFLHGKNPRSTESFSQGTLDSLAASSKEVPYEFRDGALVDVVGAKRVLDFDLGTAIAIGGTEHFALPRFAPQLTDVNVGLGWFSPGGEEEVAQSTADGPSSEKRAEARTNVIAVARDASGGALSEVRVDGPNPYDLSGLLTAWAAERMLAGAVRAVGALAPVDAFGLQPLRDGCASVGLTATT